MKKLSIYFWFVVLILFGFLSACSPTKPTDIKITYTNQIITQLDLILAGPSPISSRDKYSSDTYELLDYDWLTGEYYDYYVKLLFNEGITKWDRRANCVVFTQKFIIEANLLYYRANFHSAKETKRLSMGMVWYSTVPSRASETGHAIVIAYTNRGWVYIDPQLPRGQNIVVLTQEQFNTMYLREI